MSIESKAKVKKKSVAKCTQKNASCLENVSQREIHILKHHHPPLAECGLLLKSASPRLRCTCTCLLNDACHFVTGIELSGD